MDLDEDLRWWVERFVEEVHTRGYSSGYVTGWRSGANHNERRYARREADRRVLDPSTPSSGPIRYELPQ